MVDLGLGGLGWVGLVWVFLNTKEKAKKENHNGRTELRSSGGAPAAGWVGGSWMGGRVVGLEGIRAAAAALPGPLPLSPSAVTFKG